MKPAKLLILGGSGEAADLARALKGDTRYDVTLSLAGRTVGARGPSWQAAHGRLRRRRGSRARSRRGALRSPRRRNPSFRRADEGECGGGGKNRGNEVPRHPPPALGAARRRPLDHGGEPRSGCVRDRGKQGRVFLTTGRMELAPFRAAPQHLYIVRSVEAPLPEDLPPLVGLITARGPFNVADERRCSRSIESN